MNTSTSWDVIDPDCDEEVAGITNRQSQHQVNRPANTNTDLDPSNLDLGLEQVSDTNSNYDLGTLYNQDFFVADTEQKAQPDTKQIKLPIPTPQWTCSLTTQTAGLVDIPENGHILNGCQHR